MSDQEEPLKQPHPDAILDDAKEIINKAGVSANVLGLLQLFQPMMSLVVIMRATFKTGQFSDEAAEEMVLAVWHKFFPPPMYYDENIGPPIDEE